MMDTPFFAVTPLVLAPLALLALLLPALLAGPLSVVRRWWVLLNVAIVGTALLTARFMFGGVRRRLDYNPAWWASPLAFWLALSLLAAAGAVWVWRRQRRAKPADRLAALTVRLSDELVLGLLSLIGLGVVAYCLWDGRPLLHPSLVIWTAAWVGTLYPLYLRRAARRVPATPPALTTQGVVLLTVAVACAAYGATTLRDPAVRWTFVGYDRGSIVCPPLVAGDRIYVAAALGQGRLQHGDVYCLDLSSGRAIWVYTFTNAREMKPLFSSPCLAGGRLYVGEGSPDDTHCKLYCMDATSGRKHWHFQTGSRIVSSPCVEDGRVYFAAGADGLYCLDAMTGAKLWQFAGGQLNTSPAVAGRHLYAACSDETDHVLCLDSTTGQPLWRTAVDLPVRGSPTVAGESVFFGLGNGTLFHSTDRPAGALFCIDAETGECCWRHDIADAVLTKPTVDQDVVYFGSRDGNCYCVDRRDGKRRWKRPLGCPIKAAPTVSGPDLYVAAGGGFVFCLQAGTGEVWRKFDVGRHSQTKPRLLSGAVVAGGHLYFGAGLDDVITGLAPTLYCLKDRW
jgi:outer membrane protein assembly factor BamB